MQDYLEAIKWLLNSAEKGNSSARALREKDIYHKWLKLATVEGDDLAQNFLGAKYYLELNIAQNYTEAANWYQKAADQGSTTAQNIFGAMNENGKGIARDYVKANMWFTISEKSGNAFGHAYRVNVEKHMDSDQIAKAQELAKTLLDEHQNKPETQ